MIRQKQNKIFGIYYKDTFEWHSFDKHNPKVPDRIKTKVLKSAKNLKNKENSSPPKKNEEQLDIIGQSINLNLSLSIEEDPQEYDFLFMDLNQEEDALQFESLIL